MSEPEAKSPVIPGEFTSVYNYVRTIPSGKVLSYGDVGRVLGLSARTVGWAMSAAIDDGDETPVPWQRVVGADGYLRIVRRSAELAQIQRSLLESEGVTFDDKGYVRNEFFMDLDTPQSSLDI